MPRLFPTYGFNGEPESKLEREFENLQTNKLDGALEKKYAVPNAKEMKEGWPALVTVGGIWYIYIRIGDKVIKFTED